MEPKTAQPAPEPPPPPSHPGVIQAAAAYDQGDFRRARALLLTLPAEAATASLGDGAAVARLRTALRLDPAAWAMGAFCGALWLYLFATVT